MEKGKRAEPKGSKPHSYGESFSVSGLLIGSQKAIVASRADRKIDIINITIMEFIASS